MRASCVAHPPKERLIILREWQVEACDGDRCAGLLLSFFEYWHNIKLEQSRKARESNDVAEKHGDERTQDESLYQFHTEKQLEEGLLGLYKRTKIKKSLEKLERLGYISIHNNPNPKYRFDRTRHFLFHSDAVNVFLANRGIKKSGQCDKSGGQSTDKSGQSDINGSAIPEITTETSSEITLKNKNNGVHAQIINYLNQKTGKKFSPTSRHTRGLIAARLREGYTLNDFKKVIDNKVMSWKGRIVDGAPMDNYLRPDTLFRPTKFESYLNELPYRQPEENNEAFAFWYRKPKDITKETEDEDIESLPYPGLEEKLQEVYDKLGGK